MKVRFILAVAAIFLILYSLNFVFAVHTTSPPSFSFNEDTRFVFNITLNNTNIGPTGNITQVNVTLPSTGGFVFVEASNGTNTPFQTFTNTSIAPIVLSWTNTTNFLINGSMNNSYFWFNATASTPGNYNITVTSVNGTGIFETNISVTVNDITLPSLVTVTFPVNGVNYSLSSFDFNLSVSDNADVSVCQYTLDRGLKNVTMTLNSSKTGATATNSSIADGNYLAKFYCNDTSNNINVTEQVNFTKDATFPLISYNGTTNEPGTNYSRTWIYVNVSATETNEKNINFLLFNSTSQVNSTNYTSAIRGINWTGLPNEIYTYNVTITDYAGNSNTTATRTMILDAKTPVVTSISPANGTSASTTTYNFTFTVDDISIANCSLILDGSQTDFLYSVSTSSTNKINHSFLSVSYHNWSINCTDVVGLSSNSSTKVLIVTAVPDDSEESSGGGGTAAVSAWKTTYLVSESQLQSGYTKSFAAKERVRTKVENSDHYVGIFSLTNSTATINVSSKSQQLVFNIGDEKKFEVTNDDYYDLLVKLNDLKFSKANITITSIHEKVVVPAAQPPVTNQTEGAGTGIPAAVEGLLTAVVESSIFKSTLFWVVVIVAAIIVVLAILAYYIYKKRRYYKKGYGKKWD